MDLEKTLEQYGLKERHAKIFLACLELGSASIQKISQKSEYARSTCEAVLESLQARGFVSSFHKKRIKYFSVENPHKIIHAAEEKAALLKKALPKFLDLYGKSKITPNVRFYPGETGMRAVLEEILAEARSEADELWSFSSVGDLFNLLGEDFYKFVEKRVARKVPSKVIITDSEKARERLRLAKQELREVKLISPDYGHHGLIFTWGKKIAMMSLKNELNLLVIESAELALTQKTMFRCLWNSLPPIKADSL